MRFCQIGLVEPTVQLGRITRWRDCGAPRPADGSSRLVVPPVRCGHRAGGWESGRKGDNVRRRGRMLTTATLGCLVLVLAAAPGALGASPNQIYKDYADNGRL